MKKSIVYLNSTDEWNLVIKSLNFSFIEKSLDGYDGYDYIYLCQGEEPKTEFYYYKSNDELEYFTSVFGTFDSFFIDREEMKTISDFDFNKAKKKMLYFKSNLVI